MRIKKSFIIMLFLVSFTMMLLTGCSENKKTPIVTVQDITPKASSDHITTHKLYMEDFLYEIYLIEEEGNQLEDYYQKNLKCSYWDYDYDGTTMRELAKSSVMASVVMHEILSDQATKKDVSLTEEEKQANQNIIANIYKNITEEKLASIGLTREVLNKSLDKLALADKYKNILCKDLDIDKAAITDSIDKNDFSSDEQYNAAVSDAIATETDRKFEPIYNSIKDNYEINIDFDIWDTVTIGSIIITDKK